MLAVAPLNFLLWLLVIVVIVLLIMWLIGRVK
jgi:hypothetical protein